ncbi:sensor histidine kinase [Orrella marina]|uniref:sensor histidine kinase n=1 Tax=Orrella marina TaxID=2163011 RepID=UPI001D130D95|nr:ATP-binding protein [Orrella marina]
MRPLVLQYLILATLALITIVLSSAVPAQASEMTCNVNISDIRAARATAHDSQPPTQGWEAVSVPDLWKTRWLDHEGPVWYQVNWNRDCEAGQDANNSPVALGIDGIGMAGEVYLNHDLIWRDNSLEEPMSMSWNTPRWWLLPESAMQDGVNSIWIRTVGASELALGIGRVRLGSPEQVYAAHTASEWRQRTVYYMNLGMSGALGGIFLVVWCLRRSEQAFGWYAAMSFCWVVYLSTILASSPWPFPDVISHSRLNIIAFLLYVTSFCMFTWRFGGQKLPRIQRALGIFTGLGIIVACFAPRNLVEMIWMTFVLIFLVNCIQFQLHAWRTREPQHILLAMCWLIFLAVGIHDFMVLIDGWRAHEMWGAVTSLIAAMFMALLLGGRLVSGMKQIESFNEALEARVTHARDELSHVLKREHQQAINHAKLQERMQIVHDLHDGLGSSLVRNMALVEQSPHLLSNERMLSLLKVLRDDLRQVIDHGSSAGANIPATPTQWMAPLRHRFTRIFDECGIDSKWIVDKAWQSHPDALLCLALTRVVEEALSNVIKHSRAHNVSVLCTQSKAGPLVLEIRDDGVGFDPDAVRDAGLSVGMRSMNARMQRLGGKFSVESDPNGTTVRVSVQNP